MELLPPTFRKASELPHLEKDLDQYYEMVSNTLIQSHTEVFNTYGDTLTNAQLLTRYGFALDANENDCITWDSYEVYQLLANRASGVRYDLGQFTSVWNDVLEKAVQDRTFESVDSQLVYFHPEGTSGDLCLNGDGKISHQLWVFLALPFCLSGKRNGDLITVLRTLTCLLAYQVALERGSETSIETPPCEGTATIISTALCMGDLARSVTELCLSRKDQLGKEGVNLATYGDLSDTLDVSLYGFDRAALYTYGIVGSTSGNGSDEVSDLHRHERKVNSRQLYFCVDGYTNNRSIAPTALCTFSYKLAHYVGNNAQLVLWDCYPGCVWSLLPGY